ncbi:MULTISPECIES: lasso peptide biosynthesis B2 protein [Lysinibacillus]|uniref:lasso peptide biosynthesis B2 protein n=1 Tax=Lysinibacillus TaxID=400634 RepID=UPI00257ADA4F|nr:MULTISPECIES: lasso peptide biosynthesis B2 protein [Lysinibacillus]
MSVRLIYETILVNYLLKKKEFGQVIGIYEKKWGKVQLKKYKSKDIRKLLKKIDKVCFWFFGNAQCLHRSLIGFKLIRKKGIPVQLIIGVKKFPFSSHAWLVYEDKVINDVQSVSQSYIEIMRIGDRN